MTNPGTATGTGYNFGTPTVQSTDTLRIPYTSSAGFDGTKAVAVLNVHQSGNTNYLVAQYKCMELDYNDAHVDITWPTNAGNVGASAAETFNLTIDITVFAAS